MLRRLSHLCLYCLSWLVFGAVCLALNAGCSVLLCLPGRERRGPMVRQIIRRLFTRWIAWLDLTGLVTVSWHGEDLVTAARPMVCIANHPSLLDATFLLARLPEAICIFKPALRRNPFLAPAAVMAGYVSSDSGFELIRELTDKVASGKTLLIFPEGTRTDPGRALNPLKPGFALIARRARAPVQIVIIQSNQMLIPRGWPWWRLPLFPCHVTIETGPRVLAEPPRTPGEIIEEVEQKLSHRFGATP